MIRAMALSDAADVAALLETLPDWQRTDRRSFLLAELPEERTSDTVAAIDSACAFWSTVIAEATARRLLEPPPSALAVDTHMLGRRLADRSGAAPLGIDVVLHRLMEEGALVSLNKLAAKPTSAAHWVIDTLVGTPLRWAFSRITGASSKPPTQTKQIVVVRRLLETAASTLIAHVAANTRYSTDLLMDATAFEEACIESEAIKSPASALDMWILASHLAQTGSAAVAETATIDKHAPSLPATTIIKFRRPTYLSTGAKENASSMPLSITDTDRGIVKLKETARSLTKQIADLESRQRTLSDEARKAVSHAGSESSAGANQHLRTRALAAIRRRKAVEAICIQRIEALTTVDSIMTRIQAAETDADVLVAYEAGTNALRDFMREKNLTPERADAVMAELEDTLADQADVDRAISDGQAAVLDAHGVPVDMNELERELDELVAQDQKVAAPAKQTQSDSDRVLQIQNQLEGLQVVDPPLDNITNEREKDKPQEALLA